MPPAKAESEDWPAGVYYVVCVSAGLVALLLSIGAIRLIASWLGAG